MFDKAKLLELCVQRVRESKEVTVHVVKLAYVYKKDAYNGHRCCMNGRLCMRTGAHSID